ncbi:MAG: hypothetical protein ACYDAN_00645 [Candidatus Limnocylindrales bacterium]
MAEELPDAAAFAPPAESTLIYCFADRYIRTPGRLETGQKIALAGVSVSKNVLVNTLFGVAFGSLASRGKLSFGEVEHKTLFIKTRNVVVAFAPQATTDGESPSSLEFDILKAGATLKDPTVKNIIRTIYGADVLDPEGRVVQFVSANMIRAGLIGTQTVERHGLVGKIAGDKTEQVVLADRVRPHAADADSAWAAYQAWHAKEPLADKILTEVSAGIASRKKSDDD